MPGLNLRSSMKDDPNVNQEVSKMRLLDSEMELLLRRAFDE